MTHVGQLGAGLGLFGTLTALSPTAEPLGCTDLLGAPLGCALEDPPAHRPSSAMLTPYLGFKSSA